MNFNTLLETFHGKSTTDHELETVYGFDVKSFDSIESYLIARSAYWYKKYQEAKKDSVKLDFRLWKRELEIASAYFGRPNEPEQVNKIALYLVTREQDTAGKFTALNYYNAKYESFASLGLYKLFRDQIAEYKEGVK